MLTEQKKHINAIGLMSGTSGDAIDGVLMRGGKHPAIVSYASQTLRSEIREWLFFCREHDTVPLSELCKMSTDLAKEYLVVCQKLMEDAHTHHISVDVVGAHGQTLWHQPPYYSLQLCNYAYLAHQIGVGVVGDVRNADIADGGEGAPFAPLFHQYVFSEKGSKRCVLNLGGIANISILSYPVRGWDIGPGMTLLDHWCQRNQSKAFDEEGQWSRTGHIDPILLRHLLDDAFFARTPPKSTGQETFNPQWLDKKIEHYEGNPAPADVQATLTELTALLCIQAIDRHAPDTEELYMCGGGTKNVYLTERIKTHFCQSHASRRISTTKELGIEPEYVEAGLIAWIALQHVTQQPINARSVTGCRSEKKIWGAFYPA